MNQEPRRTDELAGEPTPRPGDPDGEAQAPAEPGGRMSVPAAADAGAAPGLDGVRRPEAPVPEAGPAPNETTELMDPAYQPADVPPSGACPEPFAPAAILEPAPSRVEVSAASVGAEPRREIGPNWMLAFVCGWAGARSLYQALDVLRRVDLSRGETLLGLAGYSALGTGLLAFALEALLWSRLGHRRGLQTFLLIILMLLTLAGVVCLFLFKDPDPARGRI